MEDRPFGLTLYYTSVAEQEDVTKGSDNFFCWPSSLTETETRWCVKGKAHYFVYYSEVTGGSFDSLMMQGPPWPTSINEDCLPSFSGVWLFPSSYVLRWESRHAVSTFSISPVSISPVSVSPVSISPVSISSSRPCLFMSLGAVVLCLIYRHKKSINISSSSVLPPHLASCRPWMESQLTEEFFHHANKLLLWLGVSWH